MTQVSVKAQKEFIRVAKASIHYTGKDKVDPNLITINDNPFQTDFDLCYDSYQNLEAEIEQNLLILTDSKSRVSYLSRVERDLHACLEHNKYIYTELKGLVSYSQEAKFRGFPQEACQSGWMQGHLLAIFDFRENWINSLLSLCNSCIEIEVPDSDIRSKNGGEFTAAQQALLIHYLCEFKILDLNKISSTGTRQKQFFSTIFNRGLSSFSKTYQLSQGWAEGLKSNPDNLQKLYKLFEAAGCFEMQERIRQDIKQYCSN